MYLYVASETFFLPKIHKIPVFLFGKFQKPTPPTVFLPTKITHHITPRFQALRGHLEVSTVAPPDPCVTDVTSGGHWSAPQIVKKNRHGRAVGPGENTGCFSRWWQLKYLLFSSLPRDMIQFGDHIFQMGWFNH